MPFVHSLWSPLVPHSPSLVIYSFSSLFSLLLWSLTRIPQSNRHILHPLNPPPFPFLCFCVLLSVTHARICPITRLKSVFASSPSLRSCPDGPFFIMQASFTIYKVCVRERDCKISKLKCSLIWIKKKTAKNTVNTCVICNIHVEISRLFVIAKAKFPREISSTS